MTAFSNGKYSFVEGLEKIYKRGIPEAISGSLDKMVS